MSINGDNQAIPNLDYLVIAVKRSELPAAARFGQINSETKNGPRVNPRTA